MTWNRVLIVKLPELHADVKQLEAFRAYVCDALGEGTLVLPLGTTYAVEEFPALGAVEVVAGDAVPVVIGGPRPTPAGGGGGLVVGGRVVRSVPDSGTEKDHPKKELPDIPAAKGREQTGAEAGRAAGETARGEGQRAEADGDQASVGGRSGNAAVCREGVERESGHLCPVEPVLVGKGAGLDDQALRGLWAGRLEALPHAAQRREV